VCVHEVEVVRIHLAVDIGGCRIRGGGELD
jgi:hypothetical protein